MSVKNIYIIGFSGTGKSSVIKLLSKDGFDAIDTDGVIEHETGLSIREIFESRGEAEFRRLEGEQIKILSESRGKIIALGGGAVLNENNIKLIRDTGIVIWLDASSDVIYERLLGDGTRPLLSGKSVSEIEEIKISRDPLYEKACDEKIDTNNLTIEKVLKKVKEFYEGCNWTR